ncbi:MAG: sulfatase-like hydrolase/transferase [Candidatus Pacebacteria bacterium]|nr:sulfatase-like hydrolase/transferase [Candidatus Paceibacterota bacterium]
MTDTRPNLIMIMTDHWRGDCLSRLGHPVAETPHLDGMSTQGVTFTNGFTPCASCIAARRSLMTGMRPTSHGMLGYQDGRPWPYKHTLAGELARAGYQTINVGKTHFHPARLHLGFEELIVPDDYDEWIDKQTGLVCARRAHGVHANSWMARPSHLPECQQEETWLTNQAMERLNKRDPERPFFLCLSFNGPHPPWCPPQYFFDLFMGKDIPEPTVGEWARHYAEDASYPMGVNDWRGKLSPELNHRARAGYFAYLAYIDSQIGRFMEFLGRSGLMTDTMLLFTADHGEMLGDHHLWRKVSACDPSARIPFMIRPPHGWNVPRNREDDSLVGLEDIMPTFLDTAGVDIPNTVEGRNLVPLLRGEITGVRTHYHHEHSPCYIGENAYQSITSKEWKYVWNPIDGSELLFDRANDILEVCDLVPEAEYADVLAEYRALLARELQGRPEKLSDGETLTTGDVPVWRAPRKNVQ